MALVAPKNSLALGAGWLLYANLAGAAVPPSTVVASVFSDVDWPAGWALLGITREGHEFSYELEVEDIIAAEYLDPVSRVSTGRSSGISFDLMQVNGTNWKRMLNGGTLATSGSGTTLRTEFTAPTVGQEVRCMIGWESEDHTERMYAEQAFQVGSLSVSRRRGADNASYSAEFKFEPAADGQPFHWIGAGANRA